MLPYCPFWRVIRYILLQSWENKYDWSWGNEGELLFLKMSCYSSVLSYPGIPGVYILASWDCYRISTIQLMEIPEMLSSRLALVPTESFWLLPRTWSSQAIWNCSFSVEPEQWFSSPFSVLCAEQFSGEVCGRCKLELSWCCLVSFVILCRSCNHNNNKKPRGECSAVLKMRGF